MGSLQNFMSIVLQKYHGIKIIGTPFLQVFILRLQRHSDGSVGARGSGECYWSQQLNTSAPGMPKGAPEMHGESERGREVIM